MGRHEMMYDGRRLPPRNSRGEFRRRRRGDRGMYPEMQGDGRVIRSYPTMYPQGDYARGGQYGNQGGRGRGDRGDYGDYNMGQDMRGGDYRGGQMSDMRMSDGHHYPEHQMGAQTYYPIEAMGRFNGYWGMPQGDYGHDMRGRRDYGYDYGYPYGDFGETLSEKELDEFCHKLKSKLDEREKQMFSKEIIAQKAKQTGKEMKDFGEKELEVVTLMLLDDYKRTLGVNIDVMIKLAFDWLNDEDAKVRGAQKLAVYYDEIVMGGED